MYLFSSSAESTCEDCFHQLQSRTLNSSSSMGGFISSTQLLVSMQSVKGVSHPVVFSFQADISSGELSA